jgi:hypothetical protein
MIYFVVPRDHAFGMQNYLDRWSRGLGGLLSVLYYEDLPDRSSMPAGTFVFSSLDQLTPGGTRLVCELQALLRAALNPGAVLNDPQTALQRFELLDLLHRQGLNRHRVARASGDLGALRFPVFLREELRHTGSLSPLLCSSAELERALGRAVLQGYRLKELLFVEFCATADPEGCYRKYAAYAVGSAIIPRSLARGRGWMLKHEEVEFGEAMLIEEREYVFANPHEHELRRIFALAGIDYGRIDYALKDGAVETWEINTNPTIGPGHLAVVPQSLTAVRQPAREEFIRRFDAAFAAVDVPTALSSVPVAYSAECRRCAEPLVRQPPAAGALVHVARALRPFRPLLERAVRLASPWISRAARRLQ